MEVTFTAKFSSLDEMTKWLVGHGSTTSPAPFAAPTPAHSPIMSQPVPTGSDDDDNSPPAVALPPGVTDKAGLPWDNRIHSSNQKMTGEGFWRKRRGVSDADVQRVEAELRSRNVGAVAPAPQPAPAPMPQPVAPQPAPIPAPTPVTTAPINNVPMPVAPQPVSVPQPVAPTPAPVPPPQPAPPPPPAAAATVAVDFNFVMLAIQRGMQANPPVVDNDTIARLAAHLGVPDLIALQGKNDLCWKAYEFLAGENRYIPPTA